MQKYENQINAISNKATMEFNIESVTTITICLKLKNLTFQLVRIIHIFTVLCVFMFIHNMYSQ